jgi:hypothetical protein
MYKENNMCECIQVQGVLKPSKGCKECFPNKPHKHAELIKAWADGAEIQYKNHLTKDSWRDVVMPNWLELTEYRVKPTPKPDYVHFLRIGHSGTAYVADQEKANVKCVFDGETHELKDVKVL